MKKVILIVFLVPYMAAAQIVDNFESGELKSWVQSSPGRWKADTLSSISGKYSLHHIYDNAEAGTDRIAYELRSLHPDQGITEWSFSIRHGYEPSSSNNWMVYLLSESGAENMTISSCSGGYAIGVNITGSDDSLRLVKISDNNVSGILNCGVNWQTSIGSSVPAMIRVQRKPSGEWKSEVFKITGELIASSATTDKEMFVPAWFGISYKYSSTKDRLLWIDDVSIKGMFFTDSVAPSIKECNISGNNSVELTFSEEPSVQSLDPANFLLNSVLAADSVRKINSLMYNISFSETFINKTLNSLAINDICDRAGNCSGKVVREFWPAWPETGDILITEIMADPVPAVSLPEEEFLEISNITAFDLDLDGMILTAGEQQYRFPHRKINAHEVLILCHTQDTAEFRKFGKTCGFNSFPSLTDDGRLMCIYSNSGKIIHGVEYSSAWYKDDLKAEGGWSLEMIDSAYPFSAGENWTSSTSRRGGTPGAINAAAKSNPDRYFKGLTNAFPDDSITLLIRLSEPAPGFNSWKDATKVSENTVRNVLPIDPLFRKYKIIVEQPFKTGIQYVVSIPEDLQDFAGNTGEIREAVFGLAQPSQKEDVLFNELLFNPLPGGSDYIELFNKSSGTIDASRLYLASVDDSSADTSGLTPISVEPVCIMPSGYFTVTSDKEHVESLYPSGKEEYIFSVEEMPSMPDTKGHLLLFNRELDLIDEVHYDEKMHNPLLSGREGISLEKADPFLKSDVALNWHSAAESSGWGTPGATNSVFSDLPVNGEQIVLSSTKITPDNDGFEDLLSIRVFFPGNGYVLSATIFDEAGNLVRKLATNILSGPENNLIWDGTASDGTLLRTGMYIILITWYNDTGQTGRWKKVCSIIR